MIDIHAHILPGVDDGPSILEDALSLLREASEAGTTHIVATPHTLNGIYLNHRTKILHEVDMFKQSLQDAGIEINVFPGSDVALSSQLIEALDRDEVLTLNDGNKYLLAELPPFYHPEKIFALVFELQRLGITPVITHPERDKIIMRSPDILVTLVERGCLAQITAQSIVGGFGKEVESFSHLLLEHRLVHVIASDCHSIKWRGPDLSRGLEISSDILGHELAQKMVDEYPRCIIEGESFIPFQPRAFAKRRSFRFWKNC